MENTNEYERLKLNVHLIANYTVDDESITDSTIEECYEYIKEKDVLSLDIETTRKYNKYEREGLDPHTTNIVMLQIGDDKKQFVIDVRDIDITFLKPILEGKSVKVGHNLKFEYKHLLNYGIKLKNLYDTYIAEEVIYKGFFQRNSLEFLNIRYLNKQVNKDTRMEFLTIRDRPFTIDQIKYGAEDVLHPMLIKEMQEVRIEKEKLSRTIELEMLYIPVLGDMEYNGLHIDTEKWLKLYDSNLKKFEDTQRELDEYVVNNHFDTQFVDKQYDMFSQGFTCRISWTSSKQVVEFLRYLNICPKEVSATTKKLTYTAETKVLRAHIAKIKDEVPEDVQNFVKTYFKLKNYEQYTTTFGDKYLRHVNPITGRLHSNFRQVLNTGRISSSGPNLQNIPSGKDFRSCLTAPKGKRLINADYSGQENICLVNASLDENLLAFYASGESDMHSYNARMIFPDELKDMSLDEIKKNRPDLREIAKAVSFALAYGGNGYTISNNLGIPPAEGDAIYDAYFTAFPGLLKHFERKIHESMTRGHIVIDEVTNRKFYFSDFGELNQYKKDRNWSSFYRLKGKYERACLNYCIQGAAGSITKLAGILFRQYILDNDYENEIMITNMVHDEILVECTDNERTQQHADMLEQCMFRAGERWSQTVPLVAEAVIADYWHH